MEGAEDQKQSKYNAALSQLYRLDALWQSAHGHSRAGQLIHWNWDLDAIWRELAADGSKDDDKKYAEINLKLSENLKNRSPFYQVLQFKEIFLRKLQNKQGKGTAYVDPYDDWLEE